MISKTKHTALSRVPVTCATDLGYSIRRIRKDDTVQIRLYISSVCTQPLKTLHCQHLPGTHCSLLFGGADRSTLVGIKISDIAQHVWEARKKAPHASNSVLYIVLAALRANLEHVDEKQLATVLIGYGAVSKWLEQYPGARVPKETIAEIFGTSGVWR